MSQSMFVDEASVLVKIAKDAWKWLLGLGVIAVVIGLAVLIWPGHAVLAVAIMLGIYLVVTGVGQIVGAFAPDLPTLTRVLYVVTGSISVLVGLVCFRSHLQSVVFLALWIGIGWLIGGIARVIAALSAPPQTPGRALTGMSGAFITIGGIVMITSPIGSVVTLAIFAGIFLLVIGVSQIVEALQLRSAGARVVAAVEAS